MQHIHILGIGGTFMGSLAQLAKARGFRVTGADEKVYPPMSTQLERAGIELIEGYSDDQLALQPDVFVIGNVITRGNPLMEAILNGGHAYCSGPQWFAEHILYDRWVLAVSGTHGKTTTASMLAWILDCAGFDPGYLIGGVPSNFGVSAKLGSSGFFVVEADEYDSAFFDKRSKFIHYRPRTLVMNNLEFDHADIFPDLNAIQTQFHHLVRTVAGNGLIVYPKDDCALQEVIDKGAWTPVETLGGTWQYTSNADFSEIKVAYKGQPVGEFCWQLAGEHNAQNALAAIAAARNVGVDPGVSCEALSRFASVKRRMELLGEVAGVRVFDDFAHHPTAIATTLNGHRQKHPNANITAIIEPRSNTMKQGVHKDTLQASACAADSVYWYLPEQLSWSLRQGQFEGSAQYVVNNLDELIARVVAQAAAGDELVVMSNGGFGGIHRRLLDQLKRRFGLERDGEVAL